MGFVVSSRLEWSLYQQEGNGPIDLHQKRQWHNPAQQIVYFHNIMRQPTSCLIPPNISMFCSKMPFQLKITALISSIDKMFLLHHLLLLLLRLKIISHWPVGFAAGKNTLPSLKYDHSYFTSPHFDFDLGRSQLAASLPVEPVGGHELGQEPVRDRSNPEGSGFLHMSDR